MVINYLRRLFGVSAPSAKVLERDQHGIRQNHVSRAACKVVAKLQQHGYQTYIVGGAVRDLIHGLHPKDFDVATGASPRQVHAIFRRSRMIGRRFPIVHVLMDQETIEVTTFRSDQGHDTDEQGRILRDASFGTLEQDARRRDFTINALYYNPTDETVLDFFQGVPDLKKGHLRIIGNPSERYREDPVRMLRAVRLATKLNLRLVPNARTPIRASLPLLQPVPSARLFDELSKMLLAGHAQPTITALAHEGLAPSLLPLLTGKELPPFIQRGLGQTDERVRQQQPVSLSFVFAVLLWPFLWARWQQKSKDNNPFVALSKAMGEVLGEQGQRVPIPQRLVGEMRPLWEMQLRLERTLGKAALRLLGHPRFRAGFDFLKLRAESGEPCGELLQWWQEFVDGDDEARDALLAKKRAAAAPQPRRRSRSRRGRRPATPA